MSQVAWGKVSVLSVGLCALGYGLLKYTTPSDKELYDALSPELKRQVDARRLARANAGKVSSALTSDPDEAKPVWADKSK